MIRLDNSNLLMQVVSVAAWFVCVSLAHGEPPPTRETATPGGNTQPPQLASKVDFARDVVPILTRAGCNSGACHGAAAGRGYLALSLYGSRPRADYRALVHAANGRFIDLQTPAESLMLQMPTGQLDHGGGVRLEDDGHAYQTFLAWLEQSATPGSLSVVTNITVHPSEMLELKVGESASLRVMATWEDGTQRQVSDLLVVDGADTRGDTRAPLTAQIESQKLVLTAARAGYTPVTLRYGPVARTVQVWSRDSEQPEKPSLAGGDQGGPFAHPAAEIDRWVAVACARAGERVAGETAPHVLARRLWLDLIGRQPTRAEWQHAVVEIEQGEYTALVDRLLADDSFYQTAGGVLASWVADATSGTGPHAELADSFATELAVNDDLRQLARRALVVQDASNERTSGEAQSDTPAASRLSSLFHRFARDPRTRAELVAGVWMGVRIGCAQCHDHPLDHWTQDDYFAMAACWAEVEAEEAAVRRIRGRTTTDLRSGLQAVAKIPGESQPYNHHSGSADIAFSDWLCSESNPQFDRNAVNRVWHWLMGVALVEEIDDHRATNPAINPELLNYLTECFQQQEYSLSSLVRAIVLSDTYRRVSDADSTHLAHRLGAIRAVKPIAVPLELLSYQALVGVSIAEASAGQTPLSADASMMQDAMQQPSALSVENSCGRGDGTCSDLISESLDLAAGQRINGLVQAHIKQQWQAQQQPRVLLETCFESLFGHSPPESSRAPWENLLPTAADDPQEQREIVEDIVWSWLVSNDFRRSH